MNYVYNVKINLLYKRVFIDLLILICLNLFYYLFQPSYRRITLHVSTLCNILISINMKQWK